MPHTNQPSSKLTNYNLPLRLLTFAIQQQTLSTLALTSPANLVQQFEGVQVVLPHLAGAVVQGTDLNGLRVCVCVCVCVCVLCVGFAKIGTEKWEKGETSCQEQLHEASGCGSHEQALPCPPPSPHAPHHLRRFEPLMHDRDDGCDLGGACDK